MAATAPVRIKRSLRDMLIKGSARVELSASDKLANAGSQRPVYIPPPPKERANFVPTGRRDFTALPEPAMQAPEVKPVKATTEVKVKSPVTFAAWYAVQVGGVHPVINRQAWLEANSHNNLLLPSAANYLCPKCGFTRGCECDKYDSYGRRKC